MSLTLKMLHLLDAADALSSDISGHNENSSPKVCDCGQTLPFSPSHTHICKQHREKHLRGWVRPMSPLSLSHINTHPAEARQAAEPLPGYMEGQSVLSYCTLQPLSTAAPYRVHKAWWMAYHHLPLWWLLNAVTPRQAHARRWDTATQTGEQGHSITTKTKREERKKAMLTKLC